MSAEVVYVVSYRKHGKRIYTLRTNDKSEAQREAQELVRFGFGGVKLDSNEGNLT